MSSHVVNFSLFILFYAEYLFVSVLLSQFLSFALSSVNVKNGADAVISKKFIFNSTDVQRKKGKRRK